MQNNIAIGPLSKVLLNLAIFRDGRDEEPSATDIPLEFVYGIGTEGLNPFEHALHGLSAGARIKIRVETKAMQSYFEHLSCPFWTAVPHDPPFNLVITVQSVSRATDRELVRAMANRDGTGCDCNCGCGC